MTDLHPTRRDVARLAGVAGLGVAAPALLGGCADGTRQAGAVGATAGRPVAVRAWRVSGTALAGLGGFDATIQKFMQERRITAGQLAVVRKGKLLLAHGYTLGDASLSVQPTSLFRVASLSKPVTATAIHKLVQDGKLKLTDRVATLLGLSTAADPRLKDVTVLRLLQHLGGWDRNVTPDVMFRDLHISRQLGVPMPISRAHVMKYASTLKLDHAPGTVPAYSNYGYLLLGRIIEKASGMSYGAYVQQKVLTPRGIKRMKLGRTLTRATGEVTYLSDKTGPTVFDGSAKQVPLPNGAFNLENMDAHGGWLSTAVDLVRFAGIYDAPSTVLNAASIKQAFAKPATGVNASGYYYGAGWLVRPVTGGLNTWHDGSLAGTTSLLVRRFDGLTWAVLFNRRQEGTGASFGEIDGLLHKAAAGVKAWPTGDLYPKYF
ncbi:serine hydrolase domain-containing protein [Actinomadura hibisca]|uniref:serine hydrolase domain-containing protein n=1 Tax=Actinomadura hibisca TaxID=68565 RepID=UPI0009FCDA71|nr:serine hydrolase domain-containing protein [Actinomadura hibisca]